MGDPPTVEPDKGFVQGSVSGPEQAKPAQAPILSIRAQSPAHYTTFMSRQVHAAGCVEDIEHYGNGIEDLIIIMKELNMGSPATGIGFSWDKFTAFASDWDHPVFSLNTPVLPTGSK